MNSDTQNFNFKPPIYRSLKWKNYNFIDNKNRLYLLPEMNIDEYISGNEIILYVKLNKDYEEWPETINEKITLWDKEKEYSIDTITNGMYHEKYKKVGYLKLLIN